MVKIGIIEVTVECYNIYHNLYDKLIQHTFHDNKYIYDHLGRKNAYKYYVILPDKISAH